MPHPIGIDVGLSAADARLASDGGTQPIARNLAKISVAAAGMYFQLGSSSLGPGLRLSHSGTGCFIWLSSNRTEAANPLFVVQLVLDQQRYIDTVDTAVNVDQSPV